MQQCFMIVYCLQTSCIRRFESLELPFFQSILCNGFHLTWNPSLVSPLDLKKQKSLLWTAFEGQQKCIQNVYKSEKNTKWALLWVIPQSLEMDILRRGSILAMLQTRIDWKRNSLNSWLGSWDHLSANSNSQIPSVWKWIWLKRNSKKMEHMRWKLIWTLDSKSSNLEVFPNPLDCCLCS